MTAAEERSTHVLEAVQEWASKIGVEVAPRILRDSNNTIVHLAPLPLVAKTGTSHFQESPGEALARELAVARHLASRHAPIVCPSAEIPAGPHQAANLIVTLWEFQEDRGGPKDARTLAVVLARVHEALDDYRGALRRFTAELDNIGRILGDRSRLSRLRDEDHEFLQGTYDELQALVASTPSGSEMRPLHGGPHLGNWMNTRGGLLLLDFEAACRGPVEWDLTGVADASLDVFGPIDRNLLALLRRMRSLCVAVKCWIDPERTPEVGEAAVVHLRLLRGEQVD